MKYFLILIPFWLSVHFTNSQKKFEVKESREIFISKIDSSVRFSVLQVNKDIKLDNRKEYYWFSQNQINKNKGGYYGKLLHGKYVLLNDEKQMICQGNFRYGLKIGQWKYWHNNGSILKIENCHSGLLDGPVKSFHDNGAVSSVEHYDDGAKDGVCLYYSEYGDLIRKSRYRDNFKHGSEIVYNNKKQKLKYKKGKLIVKTPSVKSPKVGESVEKPKSNILKFWQGKEKDKSVDKKVTPAERPKNEKEKRFFFFKKSSKSNKNSEISKKK